MKKQVAVRFDHPTLSEETVNKLGIGSSIARINGLKTFEITVNSLLDFELFSDKVLEDTGKRPTWSALFSVDIKERVIS